MEEKSTIDQIISIEWEMFRAVNEDGPKTSCQEDQKKFEGMRRAQFEAWSDEANDAYLSDLTDAVAAGRNLTVEKYIHMMKTTSPAGYDQLASMLVFPGEAAMALVNKISDKMLEQIVSLFDRYPYVAGCGRPVRSEEDSQGATSIETYNKGELMTYSGRTLELLYRHITELEARGVSLSKRVLENSAKYYGYKSLDEAEAATKARIDTMNVSFGCGDFC